MQDMWSDHNAAESQADLQPVARRAEAQIEALLHRRGLKPGQRLPSERALAQQLGVSRASLRQAIVRLAARGLVQVRKTGLVAAQPQPADWAQSTIAAPLTTLMADRPGYGQDVMEIRLALEGTAAHAAALRADDQDKTRIRDALEAIHQDTIHQDDGGDPIHEARLDAAFHLAIARASHNIVLHQVMSSLFGLLQASILDSLGKLYLMPQIAQALALQHRAIWEAIDQGDAEGARAASDRHLEFVQTTINRIDQDLARKARASAAHAAGINPEGFDR